MAIKAVLENLDGVPDHLKGEYEPGEGGKFFLKVEGMDDHVEVGGLRRAKEREHADRVRAEAERAELKKKLDAAQEDADNRLRGMLPKENVEALDKSWQVKLTTKEQEWGTERAKLHNSIQRLLVDDKARAIAAAVALSTKEVPLLLPHIKARLAVEMGADGAATRILDKDGKPSALTMDDLQKEIIADPMFSAVVLGSKATGSGAGGASSGGASGSGQGGGAPFRRDPKKKLADMSAKELGEYMAAKNKGSAAGR